MRHATAWPLLILYASLAAPRTVAAAPQGTGSASLDFSVDANPSAILAGENFVVQAVVLNTGPDIPGSVTVTVAIPPGVKLKDCSGPSGVTCSATATAATAVFSPSALPLFSRSGVELLLKADASTIPPCSNRTSTNGCAQSATLTFTGVLSSDLPSPFPQQPASVSVQVVKGTESAQMTLSAAQLDLGEGVSLSALGPHPSASITITNVGTAAVSLLGPVPEGPFGTGGTNSCWPNQYSQPTTITPMPPGSSCTFQIYFDPSQFGASSGKLIFVEYSLNSFAPIGEQVVDLKGKGLNVSVRAPQPFPLQLVGTSAQDIAYISNIGAAAANVTAIDTAGKDFSADTSCVGPLAPRSGCTIRITFTPSEAGTRTAKLLVYDDGVYSPQVVTLTGVGTAIQVAPTYNNPYSRAFEFPNSNLGVASPEAVTTITNVSRKPVAIDGISVSPDFHEKDNCPARLAAGASCQVRIWLRPPANGVYAGTLSIADDDPGSPQTLALTGTGVGIKRSKIFVHYDYMVADDHTHDPEAVAPGALQVVIDSFAAHGVELVIDPNHTAIPEIPTVDFGLDPRFACGPAGQNVNFETLRSTYFAPKRASEHYAVFAHESDYQCRNYGQSGVADLPGLNFLVSLWDEQEDFPEADMTPILAGTFMHELGHNLGLRHGGFEDVNYKPNYLSVMNYAWQFSGRVEADTPGSTVLQACVADPDCPPGTRCFDSLGLQFCGLVDYSTEVLPTGGPTPGVLDETNLDETAGLGSGNAEVISYSNPGCGFEFGASQGPVDWDGDGVATNTHTEADLILTWWYLNGVGCPSGRFLTLGGHNDWNLLLPHSPSAANATAKVTLGNGELVDDDDVPSATTSRGASPASGPEQTMQDARSHHVLHAPVNPQVVVSPGCALAQKPVAPGGPGLLTVAILGRAGLDVGEIDPASLRVHNATAVSTEIRDINSDGIPDLVARFDTAAMHLHPDAKKLRLSGWLKNSRMIFGEDGIQVVADTAWASAACR